MGSCCFHVVSCGFYIVLFRFYVVSCGFYVVPMWFRVASMWFYVVSCGFYMVLYGFYAASCGFYVVSCGFWFVSVAPDSAEQNHISGPTSVVSAVLSRPNATPLPIVCWHQISILKACESSVKIFGVLNIVCLLVGVALG